MASDWKPTMIHGRDLDDTWFNLLDYLFRFGRQYKIDEGSYAGQTRLTFDFVSGFIDHPHARPLAPKVPESSSLPPPTTDEEIEQYFANYIMNSELAENEEYKYGTWIVGGEYKLPKSAFYEHPEIGVIVEENQPIRVPNQIQWVINHFQQKGYGNSHGIITVGYPESNFAYDIPYNNESERRTSPCLRSIDFKIVENELITHCYFRSWDLVGGWPTNMGGITLLNEYVAEHLENVNPGPLAFSCKDLHTYDHAYDYVKARLGQV